ncbi:MULTISPECIES: hypothetical protein [unclassified Streptomyces]|uniref:hypothetical protein n=1 Tax=unclassified Streptomyces TaxID=2593676 RepID=UPI0035DD4638
MIVLLDRLPPESNCKSARLKGWTVHNELLAQLIEEVSLLAADRRRQEPRTLTRPYDSAAAVPQGNSGEAQGPPAESGHRKMLAAAMRKGKVRNGG